MAKASAPAAPNYAPIAQADAQAAQNDYQLGEQQLAWGQQQFNTEWPYAQQYLQAQIGASNQEQQFAQQQEGVYTNTFQPMEQQFANTASNYNTPGSATQYAGEAEADVANTFNANRQAATQTLESYGIDPSQTRFGALDLSSQVSQAAATAAAGTQSRLNTQATGLALEGEAMNIGSGYPSNVASAINTATNAGSSGISSANQTTATGANVMGTPQTYFGLQTGALSGAANALNMGFNNAATAAQINNQANANFMSGLGSLVGGALTLGFNGGI